MRRALLGLVLTAAALGACAALQGRPVPRLSAAELHRRLADPTLTVIDVRHPDAWEESDRKIRGAVREAPREVRAWARDFPVDRELVLYCS